MITDVETLSFRAPRRLGMRRIFPPPTLSPGSSHQRQPMARAVRALRSRSLAAPPAQDPPPEEGRRQDRATRRAPAASRFPAPMEAPAQTAQATLPAQAADRGAANSGAAARDPARDPARDRLAERSASEGDFLLCLYLRDILPIPLLTADEELELGYQARAGNETARER